MNIDHVIREATPAYQLGMKEIEVMRGCMGSGKTYTTLKELDPKAQTLFVAERLEAGKSAQKDCPALEIVGEIRDPSQAEGFREVEGSKLDHLKELLLSGESCVCTHSLFRRLDAETREIIQEMEVHCVIDELLESTVEIKGVPSDYVGDSAPVLPFAARKMLENSKVLDINKETHVVSWNERIIPEPKGMGVLDDIYSWAKSGVLLWFAPTSEELSGYVVTTFPVQTLACFESVKLLCYGFEGLPFQGYLDTLKIPYKYNDRFYDDKRDKAKLRERIELIQDCKAIDLIEEEAKKINKDTLSLSRTCSDKLMSDDFKKELGKAIDIYAKNSKLPADKIGWTCFKSDKDLIAAGFKKKLNKFDHIEVKKARKGTAVTFISNTTKGTNLYKNKELMINACQLCCNPNLKNFFASQGFNIDLDAYTLEACIQWMMRGCARDKNSTAVMKVLFLSERARNLVSRWLIAG